MKIKQQVLNIHQLNVDDVVAIERVENILSQLQEMYPNDCVLGSPNDGEIIGIDELARVKGVLSFIMMNRVVEVNPR